MIGNKNYLFTCVLLSIYANAQAYVSIEQPVTDSLVTKKANNSFDYKNTTSIESDVRWRGTSLTNQRPGWTSHNNGSWKNKKFKTLATVNLFSNASNTSDTSSGTTAQINHMMIESKIGTSTTIKRIFPEHVTVGIARVMHSWPGGRNWTRTSSTLSPSSKIKPLKNTELTLSWSNLLIEYAKADESNKKTIAGAEHGKNWGDYLHLKTSQRPLITGYTYNLEAGYWKAQGRYYQGNINYPFTQSMSGVLKVYTFSGFSGNESDYGVNCALKFKYQTTEKK